MNSRCVLDQRQPLQMRDVIGARRPVPEIPWCAVCGAEQTQRLDAGKIISDGRPACSMASAVTGTLTPATMPIWVAVTMNDDAACSRPDALVLARCRSVEVNRITRHIDLELLEPLEQVGLEVGNPRAVLGGVLHVDTEQEQAIVVPHAGRGPAAQGDVRAERERTEGVGDLLQ